MGDAIERLAQKVDPDHVALTRIFIPPYVRVREGQVEHVDSYWREIDSIQDLSPEEQQAIAHNADAEMWDAAPRPRMTRMHGTPGGPVSEWDLGGKKVPIRGTQAPMQLPRILPQKPEPTEEERRRWIREQFGHLALLPEDESGGNLPTSSDVQVGERVVVNHDLGDEEGTVISAGRADPMVTVEFDDGTVSSWLKDKVRKKPRLEVTDEGIFDVTGQPDLNPPDLPGGNLPTEPDDGFLRRPDGSIYGRSRPPDEPLTASGHRPLHRISDEIARDWGSQKGGVNFAAKPYLDAMRQLNDIRDQYGYDSATSVIAYFLSNASQWRGPEAKRIKAELKDILKKNKNVPFVGTQNF